MKKSHGVKLWKSKKFFSQLTTRFSTNKVKCEVKENISTMSFTVVTQELSCTWLGPTKLSIGMFIAIYAVVYT